MKYNITINQKGIVDAGLHEKTDLVDWAIIDYLKDWYFAETRKIIFVHSEKEQAVDQNNISGMEYVWLNYKHLIESMPLLKIRNKAYLSQRISKLRKLNLIKTFQSKDNSLYFILTAYCISTFFSKHTENPTDTNTSNETDNDTEKGVLSVEEQGVKSGLTGGVKPGLTAQVYNHINYNNQIIEKEKINKKEKKINTSERPNTLEVVPSVFLTEQEIQKLVEHYSLDVAVFSIKELYMHKHSNSYKCKNDYLALLKWCISKVLKDMGISRSRIIYDQQRQELLRDCQDFNQMEKQKFIFDNLFPHKIAEEQIIYDKEKFLSKLKEVI